MKKINRNRHRRFDTLLEKCRKKCWRNTFGDSGDNNNRAKKKIGNKSRTNKVPKHRKQNNSIQMKTENISISSACWRVCVCAAIRFYYIYFGRGRIEPALICAHHWKPMNMFVPKQTDRKGFLFVFRLKRKYGEKDKESRQRERETTSIHGILNLLSDIFRSMAVSVS